MHIIELGGKVVEGVRIGRGNAGDTAVGSAFAYLFKREFPGSKVTFMQSRKVFTQEDIDFINEADLIVLAGGGLFLYDTFKNDASDWQWGISEELLDKIKIPIVVLALGYNKFREQREFREIFDKSVGKLVEKSVFFGLRNSGSCRSIRRHISFENREKVNLHFCPTLLLNNELKLEHDPKSKRIGFVLAGDRIKNRHADLEEFGRQIQKFVDYIKSKGYTAVLINHLHDYWISKYVKFDEFVELFDRPIDFIYETYSKIDTVIGDRGHGQMMPFACGCKLLCPISHDKVNWFLEDIGLEEFGVEENDKDLGQKMISKFEKLHEIDWKKLHNEKMKNILEINSTNMNFVKKQLRTKYGLDV